MHGYQKKVVYVKDPESRIFDGAYFVLREGNVPAVSSRDMVEEATRIIERECFSAGTSGGKRRARRTVALLAAFLLGGATVAAVFLWVL